MLKIRKFTDMRLGKCIECGRISRTYTQSADSNVNVNGSGNSQNYQAAPVKPKSASLSDGHTCDVCGGELYNGKCLECGRTARTYTQSTDSNAVVINKHIDCSKIFVSMKEKYICSLGNTYFQSFIANGTLSTGFAVLSDKRVYFKGKIYNLTQGKKWFMTNESKSVDLKDVTGTSVQEINNIGLLVCGVVFFVLAVALFSLICIISE